MYKFKYLDEFNERQGQEFDKDEITITKGGKTYNVYEAIQKAGQDCDVYEVLEKYGCIEKLGMDAGATYADFTEIQKIRSPFDAQKRATDLWNGLPLEVRKEFDYDANNFMKNGEKWLKNKIKEEESKKYPEPNPETTQTTTQEK